MRFFEYAAWSAVVLIVVGTAYFVLHSERQALPPIVACTAEAKVCPDGTTVGRTGRDCEFSACPDTNISSTTATSTPGGAGGGFAEFHSGIEGYVMLGPTCAGPERTPPDPECADKAYKTIVVVSRSGSANVYATAQADALGYYKISLAPGIYAITAKSGAQAMHCSSMTVTVGTSGYVEGGISCDTGIR